MNDPFPQPFKGYELRERVGAGGFGVVYRAYQIGIGRDVAIKVILPEHANQPDFVRRFEVEAQLIARLEHPHIVPLYDYWRDPEGAYLVMRWLPTSLHTSLERRRVVARSDCAAAGADRRGADRRPSRRRDPPRHQAGQYSAR